MAMKKKLLSEVLTSSNNIELIRSNIPLATIKEKGLMPTNLVRKSYSIGNKEPKQIVKILSLPLYSIFYGIVSWGDYTSTAFNVAIIYCNNRSTPRTSVYMLQGNGNLYYNYEGDTLNLYAKLEANKYGRVDYIPFYNTMDYVNTAVVEKSDVDEGQLTAL